MDRISRQDATTPCCREDEVAKIVVGVSIQLHKMLGPGLMESVYERILERALLDAGLNVERQVPIVVCYGDIHLPAGFVADLVIEDIVILELKALEELKKVHFRQLYTYLKLADKRLGLLLNFGADYMKNGIHRIANNLPEPALATWRPGV